MEERGEMKIVVKKKAGTVVGLPSSVLITKFQVVGKVSNKTAVLKLTVVSAVCVLADPAASASITVAVPRAAEGFRAHKKG
jgi:hypothetical protein